MSRSLSTFFAAASVLSMAACSSGPIPFTTGSEAAGTGGASAQASGAGAGGSSASSSVSSGGGSSGTGGATATPDPAHDGPYAVTEVDDSITVASTGHMVAIHAAFPKSGPSAGPYPVVLMGHGFSLPVTEYYGYLTRLASHGFVALTVDFPADFSGVNNVAEAKDLLAGLDWASESPKLGGKADASKAGASGHSLGGKVALLAATMDARIQASITLDPVDGAMNCSATDCPDVSDLMPTLKIPTGFLGETTDATASFMACAPAADDYATFYAGAPSPSFSVTVLGANHMSFLDDVSTCGLVCSFCNPATASNAQVNGMAKAFVAAFYARHLRGDPAYDAFLTGITAKERYVDTKEATLVMK